MGGVLLLSMWDYTQSLPMSLENKTVRACPKADKLLVRAENKNRLHKKALLRAMPIKGIVCFGQPQVRPMCGKPLARPHGFVTPAQGMPLSQLHIVVVVEACPSR